MKEWTYDFFAVQTSLSELLYFALLWSENSKKLTFYFNHKLPCKCYNHYCIDIPFSFLSDDVNPLGTFINLPISFHPGKIGE